MTPVKRRNVQEAFVGEPTNDPEEPLEHYADGDDAIDVTVRGGKVMLVTPSGTPDHEAFEQYSFVGGEIELEDGRVLSFEIQDGAVGAQATFKSGNERDRGAGLSTLPDVPGGV
jgi:hypothetical protein